MASTKTTFDTLPDKDKKVLDRYNKVLLDLRLALREMTLQAFKNIHEVFAKAAEENAQAPTEDDREALFNYIFYIYDSLSQVGELVDESKGPRKFAETVYKQKLTPQKKLVAVPEGHGLAGWEIISNLYVFFDESKGPRKFAETVYRQKLNPQNALLGS